MKDKFTKDFLNAISEIEVTLLNLSFSKYSFIESANSYYIKYNRGSTIVEFLFGPPEFRIEMIIYISGIKYAFKELFQIPAIMEWVKQNRNMNEVGRDLKSELNMLIGLLKISLPLIESDSLL